MSAYDLAKQLMAKEQDKRAPQLPAGSAAGFSTPMRQKTWQFPRRIPGAPRKRRFDARGTGAAGVAVPLPKGVMQLPAGWTRSYNSVGDPWYR